MIGRRSVLGLLGAAPIAANAATGTGYGERLGSLNFSPPPLVGWGNSTSGETRASPPPAAVVRQAVKMGLVTREDLHAIARMSLGGDMSKDAQVKSWKAFSESAKQRVLRERAVSRIVDDFLNPAAVAHDAGSLHDLAGKLLSQYVDVLGDDND